jgi:short-chain fatty acids transporter
MKNAFEKLTRGSVKLVERFLPDPFIFAVILTFIVVVAAMLFTGQTPIGVVESWYGGFWNLLAFSMQMVLVLVTGTILATAPAFKKLLGKLASIPKTKIQAVLIVNFVALIACFINWGFGLVIGAVFAKEVAKKVKGIDYPLLIAAAYSGFLVWHAGMSGSIPLKLADGTGLETATNGAVIDPITTNLTIFSTFNLLIFGIILFTLPSLLSFMHPKGDNVKAIDPALLEDEVEEVSVAKEDMTPAERLENSRVINYVLSALGFIFIIILLTMDLV